MDPIQIARRVEERYRRYLQTMFYFRDPDFRRTFKEALDGEGLAQGPFIEGTPVYVLTNRTEDVVRDLLPIEPDPGFLRAIQGDRRLYWHQEEAISRASRGRSVLIATGTGSGKTEAFLYPILLRLYLEYSRRTLGPGVRALLLYPMNALANDQRQRLGEIARVLEASSPFRFTFGQYVGETPENRQDRHRHADHRERDRAPGELVFREEMRSTPPHILLTNYSMLEYLLTRPDDSPLFDNGAARDWRFVVIDEVHLYRGSEGAEMALLLRRLKQRLQEGGRAEPIQCIATSATLAGAEEDAEEAARFATDLCGEQFTGEDVILPRQVALDTADGASTTNDGVRIDPKGQELRLLVTGRILPVSVVGARLFPELDPAQQAHELAALAQRMVSATDPRSGSPLLSTRFHLLLRALEGAYVQFWPERRALVDPGRANGPVFEVALCRECGQHYVLAPRGFVGGKITAPVRDPSSAGFGVTYLREVPGDAEDVGAQHLELCAQCGEAALAGALTPTAQCRHEARIALVAESPPDDEERAEQLPRCAACGYGGPDPVREVVHGTDGPHAVIATTLIRALPRERQKVLAFADGRQEAAFFAWYLERSYADLATRNLMHSLLLRFSRDVPEGLALNELAAEMAPRMRELGMVPASAGLLEVRREAWLRLYRELLTDATRFCLEGVGLARWDVLLPRSFDLGKLAGSLPVSVDEAMLGDLVGHLLDTARQSHAVELVTDGTGLSLAWDELELEGTHGALVLARSASHGSRARAGVQSWDGPRTRRADFIRRWLTARGASDDEAVATSMDVLRAIWEWAVKSDSAVGSSEDRLFREDGRSGLRLNPRWYRVRRVSEDETVYRCERCGRLTHRSVDAICPRHQCAGKLVPLRRADLDPDHYRELYQDANLLGPMRVEEHTAQLTSQTARDYQHDFQNGQIQLLSSSTTFELGVDLGDLDAVLLRNVPPEASNYVQRVGRAGRRSGHPGLAITYCRRMPHDLYHFRKPQRLLLGQMRPPTIHLANPKIASRHMASHVLSYFFRSHRHRFKDVRALVGDFSDPSLIREFRSFVRERQAELESSLRAVIPRAAWGACGLEDRSWSEVVAGESSRLALAQTLIVDEWCSLKQFEQESARGGRYGAAQWAQRRIATLETDDVLSFLSRHVVIPKYGFPVDVVPLQPLNDSEDVGKVELQRDLRLAIAEFAPTSRIVANKREWESHGLKRVHLSKDREWPRRNYRHCPLCNTFEHWSPSDPEPPPRCAHRTHPRQYVVPEFGFVTSFRPPQQPKRRHPRLFTTRPYFAGARGQPPPTFGVPETNPLLVVTPASPGSLVVLCEGRRGNGFYICVQCGAGLRDPKPKHDDPYGRPCPGHLEHVSLGHEYETDVLRLEFRGLCDATGPDTADALSFSLAYALLEGAASVLEATPGDLNVTVAASNGLAPWPIILYDDVPGGAGLVAKLGDAVILRRVMEAAAERTDGGCGCKADESCYGCLRSYRNQFIHHRLSRGQTHDFLVTVLRELDRRGGIEESPAVGA